MNSEELRILYGRILDQTPDPGSSDCPSPERLQAVAEGDASAEERLSVMDHVAGCRPCQRDLALLGQVAATRPRAGRIVPVAWLAAAATVVLAFAGLRAFGPLRPAEPVLRGEGPAVITVLPSGNVTVAGARSLVWRSVPGATRFEVEILTPDGELVYSDEVRDTVASMPPGVVPSVSYRWHVTAVRADGTRTESALVTFTIVPD